LLLLLMIMIIIVVNESNCIAKRRVGVPRRHHDRVAAPNAVRRPSALGRKRISSIPFSHLAPGRARSSRSPSKASVSRLDCWVKLSMVLGCSYLSRSAVHSASESRTCSTMSMGRVGARTTKKQAPSAVFPSSPFTTTRKVRWSWVGRVFVQWHSFLVVAHTRAL